MNAMTILFSPKPFVGLDAVNQRNALASWRREVSRLCPFLTASGRVVEHLAPIFMRWP